MLPRSYFQPITNRIRCEIKSNPQCGYSLRWLPKFPGVIKHQLPQLIICFKKTNLFFFFFWLLPSCLTSPFLESSSKINYLNSNIFSRSISGENCKTLCTQLLVNKFGLNFTQKGIQGKSKMHIYSNIPLTMKMSTEHRTN